MKTNDLNIFLNEKSLSVIAKEKFAQKFKDGFIKSIDEKRDTNILGLKSFHLIADLKIDSIEKITLSENNQSITLEVKGSFIGNITLVKDLLPSEKCPINTTINKIILQLEWINIGEELYVKVISFDDHIKFDHHEFRKSTTEDITATILDSVNSNLKDDKDLHIILPKMPILPYLLSNPEWKIIDNLFVVGTCLGSEMPNKEGILLLENKIEATYHNYDVGLSLSNDLIKYLIINENEDLFSESNKPMIKSYQVINFNGDCGEAGKGDVNRASGVLDLYENLCRINNNPIKNCVVGNNEAKVFNILLLKKSGLGSTYRIQVDAQGPKGFGSGSLYLAFRDKTNDVYYLSINSSSRAEHVVDFSSEEPQIIEIYWSNYSFTIN